MGSPKRVEWPMKSNTIVQLPRGAIVFYKTLDKRGCARLNQRALAGHDAYVIMGHYIVKKTYQNRFLYLYPLHDPDNPTRMWTCEIDSRGIVSSVGTQHEGLDVAVVVL